MTNDQRREDEILEAIWTAEEKGDTNLPFVESICHAPPSAADLERMAVAGLLQREGERVLLSPAGREKARLVIRRHRLAERLLYDVLSLKLEDMENDACEFEHVLAPEVTESICTLLGHPRQCPHGSPIPEGECCRQTRRQVASLVFPLTELPAGESARITYINTTHHPRLMKLFAFGVTPGSRIKVLQKYPSYIIQSDCTELALEEAVAQDIHVRREQG
jgi:DtxR family Mn-dependent transcriptional regulator